LISKVREKCLAIDKNVTICAACYPEKHHESHTIEDDLKYLKQKVDCGIDFLITQVIFDAQKFIEFVVKSRENDVKIPIIPGIFIPESFQQLTKMLEITKTSMNNVTLMSFKQHENDSEKFINHALKFTKILITEINEKSPEFIAGFHFYTMNNLDMLCDFLRLVNFLKKRNNNNN
jgi:methylenetetrahydrofolate reductase (NADPH)